MTPFRILRTAKLSCLRSDGCGPSSGQVRTHEFYAESQQLRANRWHAGRGGLAVAAGPDGPKSMQSPSSDLSAITTVRSRAGRAIRVPMATLNEPYACWLDAPRLVPRAPGAIVPYGDGGCMPSGWRV